MAERDPLTTPHDRLVRRMFARPAAAAVLLRRVLPRDLQAHLNLARIHVESTAWVGPRLRQGYSDLVYAIEVRGSSRPVIVFAAVEHQSSSPHLLPLRMVRYIGWLWDRVVASKGPRVQRIPLVLPIVMVQCPSKWNGPNRLSDCFDIPPSLKNAIRPPMELELWIDDLGESVLDDPVADPITLATVELTRALLFGYHQPASLTKARIEQLATLFETVVQQSREDAAALWTYVMSVYDEDSLLRRHLLVTIDEENRDMFVSMKDAWLAEGMAEGMAEALLQVLEHRQLAIDADRRREVLAMRDQPTLRRWLGRALTADSSERVFGPATPG